MDNEYEHIQLLLGMRGLRSVIEPAIDQGTQLTVVCPVDQGEQRVFSLAKRDSGWFLLGLEGLYRIGRDDQLLELCDEVVALWRINPSLGPRSIEIERAFVLERVDLRRWREEGEDAYQEELQKRGWILLSDEDMHNAWTEFARRFSFHRATTASGWPGIDEPMASTTWDVTSLFELYEADRPAFQAVENSLRTTLASALKTCTSPGDGVFALNLNHSCYRFDPHRDPEPEVLSWPISVISVGNYHVFLTEDFASGIFGHPWECSLCCFGVQLEPYFRNGNLTTVLRSGGRRVGDTSDK